MRHSSLMVVFWMSVITSSAMAEKVHYSTQGRFTVFGQDPGPFFATNAVASLGSGANTASIVFNGLTDVAVDVDSDEGFTFASLGQFVTTASGTGATLGAGKFELRITQTDPEAGSSDFVLMIYGNLRPTDSSVLAAFYNGARIGGVTYTVHEPLPLVAPSSNGGVSTMQARITVVPEPASLAFLMSVAATSLLTCRRRVA